MFEKDEDYRKARKESKDRITKVIKFWSAREETLHDEGFQKGAEFGYNKAKEELKQENARLKESCDSLQELVTYYQTNFCQEGVVLEKEKELEIREDRLCEHCDEYKSFPDGKRCRTCDDGSKWKRGSMAKEGIKEETCKYCHNFYSTLCHKCGVYTGKGVPDFYCHGDKKEVQQNWKNYLKAIDKLEQYLTEELMKVKEQKQKMKTIKQKKCKNCKGKGYVQMYFMGQPARGIKECPVCKGTGKNGTEIKEST